MRYLTADSWSPAISTNVFFQNSYPANFAPPYRDVAQRMSTPLKAYIPCYREATYLDEVPHCCGPEACEQRGRTLLCNDSSPAGEQGHTSHRRVHLYTSLHHING